MKKSYVRYMFLLTASVLLYACSSSKQGLFSRKTPHERYQSALKDAGLSETILYRAWINAAERGLKAPISISIPYKETGFFPAETPRSSGYAFNVRKGEKISFNIDKQPMGGLIFSELWKMEDTARKLLYAADSLEYRWEFEIKDEGKYMVRLQPELLHNTGYTVNIATGPSLAFPVRTTDKPRTTSFWGDNRDAGARKHEGIDIFAAKRTPAVAAAEGTISRVGNNNLGGKIIFMRPDGKNYNLYYAHLDTQMVREGQRVKAGEIIGLIGNTGNARTTPPHLHFGIYSSSGAVDPFPFVNADRPSPPAVSADTAQLNVALRTNAKTSFLSSLVPSSPSISLEAGTFAKPIAATGNWYKVELPDGTRGYIKDNLLTAKPLPKKFKTVSNELLNAPISGSPVRAVVQPGSTLTIYGLWREYAYVENGDSKGWVNRQVGM